MKLSPAAHLRVQQVLLLCNYLESLLKNLRQSLVKMLEDELGINLGVGNYTLDPETGEVSCDKQ
jgi:hypothetical protein